MSINLLIATFSDPSLNEKFFKDNKLKRVLEKYSMIKHNIHQITIILSIGYIDKNYTDYVRGLNNIYINDTIIKVIEKENDQFYSYSSYLKGYKSYPDFDYYILSEDDYYFTIDNFDKFLIEAMGENDFLCGSISKYSDIKYKNEPFIEHSITISKKPVMEKYELDDNHFHQMSFSKCFLKFNGIDFRDTEYFAGFYHTSTNDISFYGKLNGLLILQPIQK